MSIIATVDEQYNEDLSSKHRMYRYWKDKDCPSPAFDSNHLLRRFCGVFVSQNNALVEKEIITGKTLIFSMMSAHVAKYCDYTWFEESMNGFDTKNIMALIDFIKSDIASTSRLRDRNVYLLSMEGSSEVSCKAVQKKIKGYNKDLEECDVCLSALNDILQSRLLQSEKPVDTTHSTIKNS